jgi:hypothetical protein
MSDFNETLIFSTDFRKNNLKYQVSSKSVLWEPSCSMRTDGPRDGIDDANSRFLQLCEGNLKNNTDVDWDEYKSIREN